MSISLTRAQVREVDRRAIEDYGIPGIVLMENAGRGAAETIHGLMPGEGAAVIVCGSGNNGGDGFVIARQLVNRGRAVEVLLACDPSRLAGEAKVNHAIVHRMGIAMQRIDSPEGLAGALARLRKAAVVVDAILGTGFSGAVRAPLDDIISAINTVAAMVVAVDLPSGLDCDTGAPSNATIRAAHTITFVGWKRGFREPGAAAYTGEVHVCDIGAPDAIVEAVLREMA